MRLHTSPLSYSDFDQVCKVVMEPFDTWTFLYNPLDQSRNQIRLVHIHSAPDHETEISCSFKCVSLDDPRPYIALSYCWGSPQKSRFILLDKQKFAVTENLYEALLEFRRYNIMWPVGIWIDQICINQNDVEERNREVLRMLDIYRGAVRVVVWLGSASDRTAEAIKYLKRLDVLEKTHNIDSKSSSGDILVGWIVWLMYYFGLLFGIPVRTIAFMIATRDILSFTWIATRTGLTGKLFKALSAGTTFWVPLWGLWARLINTYMYYAFLRVWWLIYVDYHAAWEHNMKGLTDANVHALKDFFSRDWFRRVWVVQEISVSRDAIVLCGQYTVEWEVIVRAVKYMEREVQLSRSRHPYLDTEYYFALAITTTSTKFRSRKDTDPEVNTLYLLSRFCYNKATIAHDKAYALLGLCAEVQNPRRDVMLKPRYDKPVEYAFADVVRYSIESTQRLDILRACTGHRSSPHMPTWVPDWRIAERKDNGENMQWETRYTLPDLPDPPMPVAEFSADLKSLHVRGVIIGHLANAGEEDIMMNTTTRIMKNIPADIPTSIPSFNLAYAGAFLLLLGRSGVLYWIAKFIARRVASRFPGTIFEDIEEVVDIYATELKEASNPKGERFWKTMSEFWKTDIPLAHDVPHFDSSLDEVESWERNCEWKAIPELGLHPLLPVMCKIKIAADSPQPGDTICMMLGSNTPFILRENCGFHELIGCGTLPVLNRYMWNSVMKAYQSGTIRLQEFVIR